jgi:acyl-CoA thioester hydrolase
LNQRPPACEADALPLSYAPSSRCGFDHADTITLPSIDLRGADFSHAHRTWRSMLEGFPLISRFSVPFADIDMMLHANNVAYIRWAEMMRSEYFAQVTGEPINGKRGIIQATIDFTYERQLRYREMIVVGCRIPRIGTKSWDFEYEIWSEAENARAARGITTVVAYDFVDQRTIAVPREWREAIAAFEAGPQRSFV